MEREIERCIAEQDECGELLRSDCPDQRGARLWASDLIKEEILLRKEGCEVNNRKADGTFAGGADHPRLTTTHGMHKSPEYAAWVAMIQRCENPVNPNFKIYGLRGISVSSQWSSSFEAFLRDVGPRPSTKYSLDRIDNEGHYAPGNVKWATKGEQLRNTRRNKWIEFNGKRMVRADWAKELGIVPSALDRRLLRYPLELALQPGKYTTRHEDRPVATTCLRGHLFSGANLRLRKDGSRACRACDKLHHDKAKGPIRDKAYLAWIRLHGCTLWPTLGCCWQPVEAAHVGDRGLGQKCSDREAIPLCSRHHRTGKESHHELGKRFWGYHGLDKDKIITELNRAYDEETKGR